MIEVDNNAYFSVYFFSGVYILMALDFTMKNIGFLISMMVFLSVGTIFAVRWIIVKRKQEKYSTVNPIMVR